MSSFAIGLDVGGTKITGIVYDGRKIARSLTVATPKTLVEYRKKIAHLVDLLSSGRQVTALGVGQPGIVNPKTGFSSSVHNTPFLRGLNAKKFYASLGIKRVRIDNDAHCFALAEATLGKGKHFKNFVGITLGTGIGGGIIIDHRLYRGSYNGAGHVGHIMADIKHDSEYYYQKFRDAKNFSGLAETIGILLANVMNVLDVEAIILGGSIAAVHGKKILPGCLRVARMHVVNQTMPKVLISNIPHAGAVGAALLARE